MNIKQDINMARKPTELEQKYSLNKIKKVADEQEEIKNKAAIQR